MQGKGGTHHGGDRIAVEQVSGDDLTDDVDQGGLKEGVYQQVTQGELERWADGTDRLSSEGVHVAVGQVVDDRKGESKHDTPYGEAGRIDLNTRDTSQWMNTGCDPPKRQRSDRPGLRRPRRRRRQEKRVHTT